MRAEVPGVKMKCNGNKKGFTLLEVMAASMIGAFIAIVAVGTLRTVTAARERVNNNVTVADELRFAVNMLRTDLMNLYRDIDRNSIKFVGTIEETSYGLVRSLTMRIVGTAKARANEPEGDIYEVQYLLSRDEDNSVLLRRLCPIVGIEEDIETQGGMLMTIAENILDFDIQYFDGTEWLNEWPVEATGLPGLVQVVLTAANSQEAEEKDLVNRSFIVSFPRMAESDEQEADNENQSNENNR